MAGLAVNTRGSSHEAKSGASGGLYGHRLLLVESIESIWITIIEVINWQSTDFCCILFYNNLLYNGVDIYFFLFIVLVKIRRYVVPVLSFPFPHNPVLTQQKNQISYRERVFEKSS